MTKREFSIICLEERIAPSAVAPIPSANAEHGLNGLANNHNGDANWVRHGGAVAAPPGGTPAPAGTPAAA
jgi:hypothetical protein